jgi:hypothetical protein
MHTINIPGTGVGEKKHVGKHPDDNVLPCCPVDLKFKVPGKFKRTSGGNEFYPKLPSGDVQADYTCTSPNHPVDVNWSFTEKATGNVTEGKIIVNEKGDCKTS